MCRVSFSFSFEDLSSSICVKYTKQFIVRDIMARCQSRYEIILLRSMRNIEVFGGVQFARCSLVSTERKKKEIKTKLGLG